MRGPRGGPPTSLEVFAAAKVNLGWQVGDRRPDGYHEVRGLIHTISLRDRLDIVAGEDVGGEATADVGGVPVALRVDGPEADDSLASADNLVVRAAAVLASRADPRPVSISIYKEIPVAAGLGGGSADAAGALLGLALAWGSDLTAGELLRLAAEVGSDVPAILLGGLVHCTGRGEQVMQAGALGGLGFVLGLMDARLDTAAVYARLDELGGRVASVPGWFHNDLEAAAVDLVPSLGGATEAMRAAGAAHVFLAGSGPTVVGMVQERDAEAVAERAAPAFRRIVVTRPTGWGVRLQLRGGRG